MKWDIVGLSEVRRTSEELIQLKSGNTLFYKGNENNKTNGVGFLITKNLKDQITEYAGVSERIAYITLKLAQLLIIQAYAPTSSHEEEEVEEFYDQIQEILESKPARKILIIGDFNAKIGIRKDERENSVDQHGHGQRNERGDKLINFLEMNRLFAMNSFFKKRENRKCTWRSPDFKFKNEIDYIVSNDTRIVQDVTVINRVNASSDHRMVRSKIRINTHKTKGIAPRMVKIDTEKIKTRNAQYQTKINEKLKEQCTKNTMDRDIDTHAEVVTTIIRESAEEVARCTKRNQRKISDGTKQLLEKRRQVKQNKNMNLAEWAELNKLIRKEMRKDIRNYNTKIINDTIENNKGPKTFKKQINIGKKEMTSLKDRTGRIITNRESILEEIEKYYTDMYTSRVEPNEEQKEESKKTIQNVGSEDIPEITEEEIMLALKTIKNNKAAGPDGILPEMLKEGGPNLHTELRQLFNRCLEQGRIPQDWLETEVILIHKKGDIKNLDNYRPISLLSQLYKTFTRIISNRITGKIDPQQPREQAGFRSGFNTNDHLHTLRTLIEKCNEYNLELYLAFIDYQKAFDSIETWAVLNSLNACRIDSRYTKIIEYIYSQAKMHVKLWEKTNTIHIRRGVRQGDTISPKLFISALEEIFRKMDWSEKGINIDGERLNHLRFADDIVLISNNLQDLQIMISDLNNHSKNVGLTMNKSKTKTMSNTQINPHIQLEGEVVENIDSYIYLGQKITTKKDNFSDEITRRISLSWAAFGKLKETLTSDIPISLKRRLYNQCILPVLTYGSETWCLTNRLAQRLSRTQRAHERLILGIRLADRRRNTWIREQTKLDDIIERAAESKWRWAGHVARRTDNRWTKRILEWRPREGHRNVGRPNTRWRDDIKRHAGLVWMREAKNRKRWKEMGKAYIQQWIEIGRS